MTADHRHSIPDLGPGGLSPTATKELGVLVVVLVLEGPNAAVKPSDKPLPDVSVGHN